MHRTPGYTAAATSIHIVPACQSRLDTSSLVTLHHNTLLCLLSFYSLKLFATPICRIPSSALSLSHVSKEVNCISTRKCLLHALSQARKLRGQRRLP